VNLPGARGLFAGQRRNAALRRRGNEIHEATMVARTQRMAGQAQGDSELLRFMRQQRALMHRACKHSRATFTTIPKSASMIGLLRSAAVSVLLCRSAASVQTI